MENEIYNVPNIIYSGKIDCNGSPVEAVVLNSRSIYSGSRDGIIRIWDLRNHNLIKEIKAHEDWVTALFLKRSLLFSAGKDGIIKIWNAKTGELIRELKGHTSGILDLDVRKELLASGSTDATARLWKYKTGECVRVIDGHHRIVSGVKLTKKRLVTASWDHFVKIWDLKTGNCLDSYEAHYDAINTIEAKGAIIISGDQSRIIQIYDGKKKALINTLHGHTRMLTDVLIDRDFLFSCAQDGCIIQWDLDSGTMLKRLEGHTDAILCMDKHKNFLLSGSADGTIRIWDDRSVHSIETLQEHDDIVLQISSDGNYIVSAGTENQILVWDLDEGECIKKIDTGFSTWIWGACVYDGKVIVSSDEGIYRIFDLRTGESIGDLIKHDGTTYRLSVMKNKAATTGFDNTIKIWDLNTFECIQTLRGHTFSAYTTAWIDEKTVVSSGSDSTIRVWDIETGECTHIFRDHTDEIFHIASEENLVVTASADKTLRVYDVINEECIALLEGHEDQVWSVAIKNRTVFSGSIDHTIKVWDIEKSRCVETFKGHSGSVKDLCIVDNLLLSGSKDSDIRVWDISEYIDKTSDVSSKLELENEALVALLQMARTYEKVPKTLGNPDIARFILGLDTIDLRLPAEIDTNVELIHKYTGTWRGVGHLGYGIWINDLYRLVANKKIKLGPDESVSTVVHEYMLGLRESPELYWLGLLRFLGPNPERRIPENWTFDLEFSGEGPAPLEGYNWQKLGHNINSVDLGDREETALVFRLTLNNVLEWFIPMIKSIEIQFKDDRGDIQYVEFNNFLPDDRNRWSTTGMFKIDSGYSEEPFVILNVTDIRVNYEELLLPNFRGVEILDQIDQIHKNQEKLEDQMNAFRADIKNLLLTQFPREEIGSSCEATDLSMPDQSVSVDSIQKPADAELEQLEDSQDSMFVFTDFSKKFKIPRFGTIRVHIGQYFSKFLEYIEPKFILFTAGTAIASAIVSLLVYLMVFKPEWDLLGPSFDLDGTAISLTEIAIYVLVYGVLIVFLFVSIFIWIKFQRKKRKLKLKD